MRKSKQEREDKAVEAIIAGVMRGWGQKEWKLVFDRMHKIEQQQRESRKRLRVTRAELDEPFTI